MKVLLTSESLHALGTKGAGWNKHQLMILGIKWPPKNGWLKRLIGKEIEQEAYDKILALRNKKPKQRNLAQLELTACEILDSTRPICAKCGKNNVYAVGGPHMDWCEPCLWEFLNNQP